MSERNGLVPILFLAMGALVLPLAPGVGAEERDGMTHTIFATAYEVKGATTSDKLAPPSDNPADLSKGYGFKGPGSADATAPKKWEVSSYMFNPGAVSVRQGDEVVLTVFVVNGDEHETWIAAPDGSLAVPKTMWHRGREYRVRFRADQVGAYQLLCSSHAPTMVLSFLVLAR